MFKFAIVTVSTKAYAGKREDASGPVIAKALSGIGEIIETVIAPDNIKMIEEALVRLSAAGGADAVFTTGGTGLSPDDITPEATLAVVSRQVPGISEAIRRRCVEKTDRAVLSRGVAGIRGRTLIVNLPGSPKACEECMEVVMPVLEHALLSLRGEINECAR